MITRDLLNYPDQFSSVLNDMLRRIQELEREVERLKKERK